MLREVEECAQSHTARKGRSWGIKPRLSDSMPRAHSCDRVYRPGKPVRRSWHGPGRADGGLG